MKFYLVDDDPAVIHILKLILEEGGYGELCGTAGSGADALEDLRHVRPDLVLTDLLMPVMDGIAFVREAKAAYPDLHFVMLSQVSSKDMIAEAYESGVDFFISKPINSVEVCNVVNKVVKLLTMDRALEKMRFLLQDDALSQNEPRPKGGAAAPPPPEERQQAALNGILQKLGISGDPASRDILQMVAHLSSSRDQSEQMTIAQLCERFSDSPKALEQRIRRAATAGMVNLANMGIEDYANDTFVEYAGALYNFEQVKREMDCIRGKTDRHGKVSVKKFLYSLAALSQDR